MFSTERGSSGATAVILFGFSLDRLKVELDSRRIFQQTFNGFGAASRHLEFKGER